MAKVDKIILEISFEEYHAITTLAQNRYIAIKEEIKELSYIPFPSIEEEMSPEIKSKVNKLLKVDKLLKEYDMMRNLFQKAYDAAGNFGK